MGRFRSHDRFNLIRTTRQLIGQHPIAFRSDQHIVFRADADAAPFRIDRVVVGGHVQARFDGEHHARLEQPRFAGQAVFAHIVHVQAQPVAGLVPVETAVLSAGDVLFQFALDRKSNV